MYKRQDEDVKQTLDALTKCAETGEGNLLELSIIAARARATLGEISLSIEKVSGRYKAVTRTISGVYSSEYAKDDKLFEQVRKMTDEFAIEEGRRPRIMIAKMGQDGHDRGAKVVAVSYTHLTLPTSDLV